MSVTNATAATAATDALFTAPLAETDPQIAKTLEASIALAHKTGVDGTPTFILNGKLKSGMMEGDAIAEAMNS